MPEKHQNPSYYTCTLSDEKLIEKCEWWVTELVRTKGRAWELAPGPDFDNDPDLLMSELIKRFKMEKDPENPNVKDKTLLDDFAEKAMQALIQLDPDLSETMKRKGKTRDEIIAEDAYLYASGMLRERQHFLDEND